MGIIIIICTIPICYGIKKSIDKQDEIIKLLKQIDNNTYKNND